MKCIVCELEFKSDRNDARFCSDKCRKRLSRTKEGDPVRDKSDNECVFVRDKVIDMDVACQVVRDNVRDKGYLDVEKDLGLDMKRDLGITAWTDNGIFIRPDITVKQVQAIAHLVAAKHGRRAVLYA